jgi:hypothetical protein
MANAVLLGSLGKLPDGVGPNRQLGPFKEAQGAGKQDAAPGTRQVKRGAPFTVTTPAGISEICGEAEGAMLVKAVHDPDAEVVCT